jgi:hypothetical protein
MMRGIRRLAVCTAAIGLLAAGAAVTVSVEGAHAQSEADYCMGTSSNSYDCTVTGTISDPSSITVTVTDDTSGAYETVSVDVTTLTCTDNNGTDDEPESSAQGTTTVTDDVMPLPANASDSQCDVTATVDVVPPDSGGTYDECLVTNASPSPTYSPSAPSSGTTPPDCLTEYTATLDYTSGSSATPSPTTTTAAASTSAVHPVKGYDGMCLDDNGNSSANRAKIQIWKCSGTDQAENWTVSDNELKHNGKCLNDQADAGSGGHMVLYTCTGAANDKWSVLANGELKLKAHNGSLCLNDPRSSKTNGTQLIVYKCTDSANEHWSLP